MRISSFSFAATVAALAALCAAPVAAAEIQYRAVNQNLEEARKLVSLQRWDQALEELQTAESLPGNTNRHRADIAALRASALLGLPPTPEHREQAGEALVALYHVDPGGTALSGATAQAQELATQLRSERALLLHDRLITVRSGRPIRIRVRLAGAQLGESQVFVAYHAEREPDASSVAGIAAATDPEEYVRVALDPAGGNLYEGFLRPGVGGVPLSGEHILAYYLEALGPSGAVIDSNGTARDPIRVQLSTTMVEGAGVDGKGGTLAALDEGGHIAHPPPPPPPPTPWYKRWEIVGPIGGAIVIGAIVTLIAVQPKPQPGPGTLGRVDLP